MQQPAATPLPEDAGPAGRGRPKDGQKAGAILAAARELFLELPYEQVSMDKVAARAGTSKVTVYAHHGSKDALFVAALASGFRAAFDGAVADVDGGRPLAQTLADLGVRFLDQILSDEVVALKMVLMQAHQRHPDLARRFYEDVIARQASLLAAILEDAATRGEIIMADPERGARMFCGMILSDYEPRRQLGLPLPDAGERRLHALAVTDLFLNGTRRGSASQ